MKGFLRALVLLVLSTAQFSRANDAWPQFRGPDGQGHTDSSGLPLHWSERQNIKWKTPIHGRAWSCPVVLGNQVWLTSATEDGKQLFALCVDRSTGQMIRDLKLFDVEHPQYAHPFNSYASPTPAIEPGRVYVTFGAPGTACLDTETGKVLWERRDFVCNHFRGAGSSPVIFGNLLLMHFDGSDYQFVVALDKNTGQTVWKTDRSVDFQDLQNGKPQADGDFRKAFSTPLIADFGDGPIMLSLGSKAFYAYEPLTGKEIWRTEEPGCHSGTGRPVVGPGMIFITTGFSKGQLWAIRPGGHGVVTDTHVAWKVRRSVPCKPSVLLVNDLVYMVDDGGIATCVEAKTGKEIWHERIGGEYSASPIAAGDRLYFFSEQGKTTILHAGRDFKVLAENQLGDGFMASPAVAGKALFLRSRTQLYRVETAEN